MVKELFKYLVSGVLVLLLLGCAAATNREEALSTSRHAAISSESCIAAAIANTTADDEDNYRIEPNDVLDIDFYLNPEFNDEQTVRPDGKISLRLVGEVQAKGRTPGELAQELDKAYAHELYSPGVTIHVKSTPSRLVYVDGQVTRPGAFTMEPRMSAFQAVAEAGGITEDAALANTILIRRDACGTPAGIKLDLASASIGSGSDQDPGVVAGDIIYVPRSKIADVNLFVMQRIFSSAAKGTCDAKKSSSGAGELKIHWTKPPAGCRLWVLYAERESQLGGTDRR
jgi:protein involved in polysaccharide export with SLBB domain